MNNPEKLATLGTRDEDQKKHNKICAEHHNTQTNTNNERRHEPSYKQLEVKTNQTNTNNVNKT